MIKGKSIMKKLTLATAILMSFGCLAANTASNTSYDNGAMVDLDGAQSATVLITQDSVFARDGNTAIVDYYGSGTSVGGYTQIDQEGNFNQAKVYVENSANGNTTIIDQSVFKNTSTVRHQDGSDWNYTKVKQTGIENETVVSMYGDADGNETKVTQSGISNKANVDFYEHGDGNITLVDSKGSNNIVDVDYRNKDADWNYVNVNQGGMWEKDNVAKVTLTDSRSNDVILNQTRSESRAEVSLAHSDGNYVNVWQDNRDYASVEGTNANWNKVRITQR